MREVLMHILETEPVRPSTLRKELNEDVETIVLKCLAKEPDRRYQSAAALAEDVDRYLTHQPIQARAPSTIYQIRKLVARNMLPFAFLATLFILVSGFAIWMGVLYARTAAERNRATAAEQTAEMLEARLGSGPPVQGLLAGMRATMLESVMLAHQAIREACAQDEELEGTGTTLTARALDLDRKEYVLGHVGIRRYPT